MHGSALFDPLRAGGHVTYYKKPNIYFEGNAHKLMYWWVWEQAM
jgi:hypothetical protein